MIVGIPGIVKTWFIIPEPTAKDTKIPTIQVTTPIKPAFPFAIFSSFLVCNSFPREIKSCEYY